jgi:vacuolar-type H+-ATPase subunit D/Vma8
MEAETATVSSPRTFRSANRILVRFFRKSRDRWKEKYQSLQKEAKRLTNQAADARRSRDQWREKAVAAEATAKQLEAALAAETTARAETEKKGAH